MSTKLPTLHSRTKWLHGLGIWFADWWSRCLFAVGSVVLALPTFFPSIATSSWRWVLFGGAVICIVASARGEYKRSKSIHRLENAVGNAERRSQLFESSLRTHLKVALRHLIDESGLDRASPKLKPRVRTRVTAYCHDSRRRVFIPIARYSGNAALERGGRSEYPDDQGFIAEAWADPWSYKKDLPEDFEDWVDALVTEDGLPEHVVRKLTMNPRSLAGARIDGRGASGEEVEKIGIIIIESLDARGVKASTGENLHDASWFKVVDALVKTFHRSLNSTAQFE